jgi:hypothetical protein
MSGSEAYAASRWFDAVRWLVDVKQGALPLALPILDEQGSELGELRPITVEHLGDDALLERFVVWRNQQRLGYLDQRPVTLAGVRRYVEDVVYNPTRVSFLAYCDGRPIARMGAVRIGPHEHESDGLVRGERGGGMQFVHRAQLTGMILLFYALNQTSIISRVLSTNDLARESCTSLGYDMTPFVSRPVYRIRHADGDTLETSGRTDELIEGVTLDTFRVGRRAFFERISGRPGYRALEDLIRGMNPSWKECVT